MRTVKEIDSQLQAEQKYFSQLYVQLRAYEEGIEKLKKERQLAEEEELNTYIDKWLKEKFDIQNQKEARSGHIFIVFDKDAKFIKTVTCGYGREFQYVSPAENNSTLEYWLKQKHLYAHAATSFCGRNYAWYQMEFKEQLKNLLWEFDSNGKLCHTQW